MTDIREANIVILTKYFNTKKRLSETVNILSRRIVNEMAAAERDWMVGENSGAICIELQLHKKGQ